MHSSLFRDFPNIQLSSQKELVREKIGQARQVLTEVLAKSDPNYESVIRPLNNVMEELQEEFTVLSHLNSVKNSEETQANYTEILPEITEFYTELSQNEELYKAYSGIYEKEKKVLDRPKAKVLEDAILQFKLGGVGLPTMEKDRIQEIHLRLSDLQNQFSQNLLDATNSFELKIDSEEDVKELPESDKALYRNEDGTYTFTLQFPSYSAYMAYGSNRSKREELYKAYVTRAPQNGKVLEEILSLRDESAKILGYPNYAESSLATKVADSPEQVLSFLEKIGKMARPVAQKEFIQLQNFAKGLGIQDLQAYDSSYVSEKLKKSLYDFDEEETRPYFEKNTVVKGAFSFLEKLLGLKFERAEAPIWDPKTEVFHVKNGKETVARLYLDLEARKDKQGGAWMNHWETRNQLTGKRILPSAFVICNFPPSKEGAPSLLKHSDVVTFFHEMGHALHHLCAKIDEPPVSGINGVEWDAVEFPSQFLENFAYEPEVLSFFAYHHETGKPMPSELAQKLKDTKNFLAGMGVVRQLEFGIFDIRIHLQKHSEEEVQNILDQVRKEVSVMTPPSYNKFQNGFGHIFSGGYAAGYYSYKWAELLAADAFFAFRSKGIFDEDLALKYKTEVLEKGGSENAMVLFKRFLGRDPEPDALLKLYDLVA
ncbi:M3 family peptidase [Leptospira langatensis]|uniref:oligopeptidase A n=1 Tax=Leptospira langatensis TaxID=2484983 RepID=A0A5F1ZR92_9LEPT|nr:M3 family metallopeptidase [Leptospira langatensis]TGK05406.1 M3 family peptidase [Leptospira langatensis]TGL38542.1 M3 family peptidase [Leptospira langatensis]